ncbi:Fic family protein [uncultured Parolsenella sp.]|uniref:Fic family protein n=1 Tax=uncultured Parolsenella sp. TaxID=2083008 RepID=UPI0027D98E81|nr:hypothetical protein [uncultured Parolsenella sp.]
MAYELFFWLPVEELIRDRQAGYYVALGQADAEGESTGFVEFMLGLFEEALGELAEKTPQDTLQVTPQVGSLLAALGNGARGVRELMEAMGLADRMNFVKNYLNPALEQGLVERTIPVKPRGRNQKYRRAGE